jgi:hypothetical protein
MLIGIRFSYVFNRGLELFTPRIGISAVEKRLELPHRIQIRISKPGVKLEIRNPYGLLRKPSIIEVLSHVDVRV